MRTKSEFARTCSRACVAATDVVCAVEFAVGGVGSSGGDDGHFVGLGESGDAPPNSTETDDAEGSAHEFAVGAVAPGPHLPRSGAECAVGLE